VFAVSARALKEAEKTRPRLPARLRAAAGRAAEGRDRRDALVPLALALSAQLDRIAKEGLEARWRRHLSLRDEVVRWAQQNEIAFFAQSAASARRPSVPRGVRARRPALSGARARRALRGRWRYGKSRARPSDRPHGRPPARALRALLAAIP
jgi:aspartate aminotransferase-like enzyme